MEDGGKIKTTVFQLLSPDLYNLLLPFPHLVAGVCVSVAPALNAPGERPPVLLVVVTGLAQLAELALVTGGAVAPGVKGNTLIHTQKLQCVVVKSTFGEPQTQAGDMTMRPLLLLLSLVITCVRESRVGVVACPNKSTAAAAATAAATAAEAAATTTTTTTMEKKKTKSRRRRRIHSRLCLSEDASTTGCYFDAVSSFHHPKSINDSACYKLLYVQQN